MFLGFLSGAVILSVLQGVVLRPCVIGSRRFKIWTFLYLYMSPLRRFETPCTNYEMMQRHMSENSRNQIRYMVLPHMALEMCPTFIVHQGFFFRIQTYE